ncbi:hypothetical protein L6R50_04530 [Myxococcota bacterium]|nr:hypothetical protein [Myxococcota bacterium]
MSSGRFTLAVGLMAFAGGIALGIFHATGHGGGHGEGHTDASADPHAAHSTAAHAPPAHTPEDHSAHGEPSPPGPPSATAIRDEMIALQAAYDTLNRAVVLGDPRGVAEAFHRVHARKQDTDAALAAGVARPPKNGDRIEAFVARDKAFHDLLETTVGAAGRGDLETLRRMTTELRDGCIACHEEFRGDPR